MGLSSRNFFTKTEIDAIVLSIKNAEKLTSGEIRVHVEDACEKPVLKRAEEIFQKNKMHKTKEHNAILFYLAVKTKHFAVAGDSGIHEKVTQQFWEDINQMVLSHFKDGKYAEGLCRGIALCGQQLQKYFPIQKDDLNEQKDEISFS
jgi:uncharacterized membrane protein